MGRMLAVAGVATAATIVADQASKALVRSRMDTGEFHPLTSGGAISVGHVENHGTAYGVLDKVPAWVPAVGGLAIGGALLAFNRGTTHPLLAGIGAGLVVGGAAGNVIDRARTGSVTDFLHVTDAFGYFNVADVAIDAGLLAAGGALLLKAR